MVDSYNQTRRFDSSGRYRTGPTFTTKSKLSYMDKTKPGKLKLFPDSGCTDKSKFSLLTYLHSFTEQMDKTVIDLKFIKTLLDFGIDINERDDLGQTALHAFVRDWHPDIVQFAMKHQADVNAQDKFGRSPLHLAAALDNADIARLLIMNGADPNLETFQERQTTVHFAAKYNSLNVLKELLRCGGSVVKRDCKNRTVLFVAAEKGCRETTEFLLDIGVPSSVYDISGNAALSYIIEKIPAAAAKALEQYGELSYQRCQVNLFLSALETVGCGDTHGVRQMKSPLEVIATYKDMNLIMHPVIQELLKVKWEVFGRADALFQLFLALLYICFWLPLIYLLDLESHYYNADNIHEYGWIIILEILIIIFSVYFFVRDFSLFKISVRSHHIWKESKLCQIQRKYVYCHPGWPAERDYVTTEAENIQTVPGLGWNILFWFIYEWINLALLLTVIITRILSLIYETNHSLFVGHKIVISLNMFMSFMRIIKVSVRFKYISTVLKVVSLAGTSFVQICFLYLQFYIPFVALFWLWFGSHIDQETDKSIFDHDSALGRTLSKNNSAENPAFGTMFYWVYISSFEQEDIYILRNYKTEEYQIIIGLYHLFTTFIAFSIIIAFITAQFSTKLKQCIAEASLSQSIMLILLERGLSKQERRKVEKYYTMKCNPLIVTNSYSHKRQSKSSYHGSVIKLGLLQTCLKNMMERFEVFEIKFKNKAEQMIDSTNIYDILLSNLKHMEKNSKDLHKRVLREFKYLSRQPDHVPILLSRVISPNSEENSRE